MQANRIYGELRKIELPKIGFYLVVETSEDDGDYSRVKRFFFEDFESAFKDYLFLENLDDLKEKYPDKFLNYIGYNNSNCFSRDLDSFEIVEVLMNENSLFERNIGI